MSQWNATNNVHTRNTQQQLWFLLCREGNADYFHWYRYIEHHIVLSLSYHSVEVNDVEIIDWAMSWLVASKHYGTMVVNTCQCEL